jgi:HlyD family secretion protein
MTPRIWIPLVFLAVVLSAWIGFRVWQGPVVAVYRATPVDLVQTVVATGRVVSTSRAQIGSEITGIVLQRHVREGDAVQAGDVLITLRSDELAARTREARAALQNLKQARRPQAMAALTQAESQLSQARREAQRRRDLYKTDSISREILEKAEQAEAVALANAEQARLLAKSLAEGAPEEGILNERLLAADAALAKTVIRAQFPGVVLTRNVEPGDVVQPGKALLEVARAGKTEVLVPVDERNLGVLAMGQPAVCIPDAYIDRQFNALVDHIAPSVDPQRGTVDVRLSIPNPPDYLREDMTVTATITTGERNGALAIPNDAIEAGPANRARVLVVRLGRAVEREIELGLRGLTMTEVTRGLSSGDLVVLTPGIKPGQRVKASNVD